jgi:predicted XRE-type DNA-binding protein
MKAFLLGLEKSFKRGKHSDTPFSRIGEVLIPLARLGLLIATLVCLPVSAQEAPLEAAGEVEPTVTEQSVEDASIEKILAALEEGGDIGDVLEAPAAGGGSPIAGLSVFGWLANRFGVDTPELVPDVSASAAQTSATIYPAIAARGEAALATKIRTQLLITRNDQILDAAQRYREILQLLQSRVSDLERGGAVRSVDLEVVDSWVTDAALEQSRASSRLLMSMDTHEDNFGHRIDRPARFPQDWEARHERSLENELSYLNDALAAPARRQWRTIEMEQDSLEIYRTRLQQMDKVRRSYSDHFDLGQTSIADLIGVSRMYFDVEVQKIDTEYRLYDAHAQLLAMVGRLFEGDLSPAVEADHDA